MGMCTMSKVSTVAYLGGSTNRSTNPIRLMVIRRSVQLQETDSDLPATAEARSVGVISGAIQERWKGSPHRAGVASVSTCPRVRAGGKIHVTSRQRPGQFFYVRILFRSRRRQGIDRAVSAEN